MNDNRSDSSGLRVLLVGQVQKAGVPGTHIPGGNAVMMREQQRELAARGFRLDTVNTYEPLGTLPLPIRWPKAVIRFVRVLWQVARRLRKADVVCCLQVSERLFDYGIVLWLLCKAFRRPLVLRASGGNLGSHYSECWAPQRWLAGRTSLRADIVYVETRASRDKLPRRENVRYFPNTRDVPTEARRDRDAVRRLLFLSRILPVKGVRECLQASYSLPETCGLSIYGPEIDDATLATISHHPRVAYRGVAERDEIPRVLAEHDLLLLPSYHATEGLPGVVLEALQAGMPVIATRAGGIPELIEDEVNGLIIEPRSVSDLARAIKRLRDDPALYRRLCENAQRKGDEYRSSHWYDRFASDLTSIASG